MIRNAKSRAYPNTMHCRLAAALPALLLPVICAQAQTPGLPSLLVDVDREPDFVIPLWAGVPPGGERVSLTERRTENSNRPGLPDHSVFDITDPALTVFRASEPDGSALLIIPGGGYGFIVIEHEGWESARWFARRGLTVYVMTYRLPHQGWAVGADTPLQDAHTHMGSRTNLIGAAPSAETITRYSLESAPPADSPPTILIHAGDDTDVPPENSIHFYQALQAAGVPAALHLFEQGRHGFGIRVADDNPLSAWPTLVHAFGQSQGVFE